MARNVTEDALKDAFVYRDKLERMIKQFNTSAVSRGPSGDWKQTLEDFRKPPSLMVAFLGGTGAGKSSLINAIVETDIVATSGGRACTSVITEISYREDAGSDAEVAFLSREEWVRELHVLVADIRDDIEKTNRKSRPLRVSETARSWETLLAVYRNLTLQQIVDNCSKTIDFLLDITSWPVLGCLGSTKWIIASEPIEFASAMCQWTGDKGPWPLIQKVCVHAHSRALSTGVTLVDLPGIGDFNLARSAVAEEYQKNIDHFFVVIPMTRAVDSKVTSELFGMSKTQLRMDGMLKCSKLTFIITKCDDLIRDEVVASYSLENEPEFVQLRDRLDQSCVETEIAKAEEALMLQRRIEWEDRTAALKTSLPKVEEVPTKRTLFDESKPSCIPAEQYRYVQSSDDGEISMDDPESHSNEFNILRALTAKRKTTQDYEAEQRRLEYGLRAYCAQYRSKDMSDVLLDRFTEELDNDEFVSETAFTVFTVATRDYLIINKRITGDVVCFLDAAATEIPAVQEHCCGLPLRAQQEFVQRAFVAFKRVACSMSHAVASYEKDEADCRSLATTWGSGTTLERRLLEDLKGTRDNTVTTLKNHFKEGLMATCSSAANLAIEEAPLTTERLMACLSWQRLRATFRRLGVFQDEDINSELTRPFLSTILDSWRATLDKDVFPEISEDLCKVIQDLLDQVVDQCLSTSFKEIARDRAAFALKEATSTLHALHLRIKLKLDRDQKTISRSIITCVQEKLEACYEAVLEIRGKGSAQGQKDYFINFMEENKERVFEGLAEYTLQGLDILAQSVWETVHSSLPALAEKVHYEMSSLWEEEVRSKETIKLQEWIEEISEELEGQHAKTLMWSLEQNEVV